MVGMRKRASTCRLRIGHRDIGAIDPYNGLSNRILQDLLFYSDVCWIVLVKLCTDMANSTMINRGDRDLFQIALRKGLHVDLLPFFRMNRAPADRKSFLHRFPAIVITAPGKHGKCLFESALPRTLRCAHSQMPLMQIFSNSQMT
jgi:hypothetical protein